jgi:dihydrodipicolinate synthase/N-acetylneuraminate lyase
MRVDNTNSHSALRGVWALLPTPFTDEMDVDLDGFRGNINYIQGHDISIYCVACGVGEPWSLNADEVVALAETARAEIGDEAVLVVGVGDPNLQRAIDLVGRLEAAGADMLMIMPPTYPKPEDAAILGFYKRLAEATTLPFQIYPVEANPPFRFELVEELLEAVPNIVSIKDVSHNVSYPYALHRRFGDRVVIVQGRRGETEARLVWFHAVGIQSYYSNLVNFRADLAVEHWEALERGDFETVVRIAQDLEPYANLFPDLAELGGATRYRNIQILKAVMGLAGLAGGKTRPPLVDLGQEELQEIESAVIGAGIVSSAVAS